MSQEATQPAVRVEVRPAGFLELIPGLLLLGVIGFGGKVTEQSIAAYGASHHIALPNIEYVLWAILYGLIISNVVGIPGIFRPGVATYEFWLKAGIVLTQNVKTLARVRENILPACHRC
jgi:hypothetical protein